MCFILYGVTDLNTVRFFVKSDFPSGWYNSSGTVLVILDHSAYRDDEHPVLQDLLTALTCPSPPSSIIRSGSLENGYSDLRLGHRLFVSFLNHNRFRPCPSISCFSFSSFHFLLSASASASCIEFLHSGIIVLTALSGS